jgi:hypothetical protein
VERSKTWNDIDDGPDWLLLKNNRNGFLIITGQHQSDGHGPKNSAKFQDL